MLNPIEYLEYLKTVQGILEGLKEFDQGQGQPATEALAGLRTRLNAELNQSLTIQDQGRSWEIVDYDHFHAIAIHNGRSACDSPQCVLAAV
ncbi:hypothetical protein [Acaryochloris sp. IP29b_bin.137]|uniref:hypothetical protein n=1 Tax=Acaryochloris sp. IP29b_bin.137 TaxID=2969217 RepID=UPI00262B758D|nr:hypothetical protein [Acaryochloris sp. IP29b_bin.137]